MLGPSLSQVLETCLVQLKQSKEINVTFMKSAPGNNLMKINLCALLLS